VPGTHGIVFPWAPPSFGIPKPVLEQLEQNLIQKLTNITEEWIENAALQDYLRRSRPSSPDRFGFEYRFD
jgi:hypothetical protein